MTLTRLEGRGSGSGTVGQYEGRPIGSSEGGLPHEKGRT